MNEPMTPGEIWKSKAKARLILYLCLVGLVIAAGLVIPKFCEFIGMTCQFIHKVF
jgi:hypothetical protein